MFDARKGCSGAVPRLLIVVRSMQFWKNGVICSVVAHTQATHANRQCNTGTSEAGKRDALHPLCPAQVRRRTFGYVLLVKMPAIMSSFRAEMVEMDLKMTSSVGGSTVDAIQPPHAYSALTDSVRHAHA